MGSTKKNVKVPKCALIKRLKKCLHIKTVGLWSWKSKSAKECVTTHQPNVLALKMDGAKVHYLNVLMNKTRDSSVGGCDGS